MIRPLLAADAVLDQETGELYPINFGDGIYVSRKLDGVRAVICEESVYSRSAKAFNNKYLQEVMGDTHCNFIDGEVIVGSPTHPKCFNLSSGPIRKGIGKPDFRFYAFDFFKNPDVPFEVRKEQLAYVAGMANKELEAIYGYEPIILVDQYLIHDMYELLEYEQKFLSEGYEGLMGRSRDGRYKNGRSTLDEGILFKLKRYSYEEAEIIDYECEYENTNEAFLDELGRTKRSSSKEGKVARERLAKFICRSPRYDEPFKVSCSSMTHKEKEAAWICRDSFLGKICRFKHFKYGALNKPRNPVYAGIRDKADIS